VPIGRIHCDASQVVSARVDLLDGKGVVEGDASDHTAKGLCVGVRVVEVPVRSVECQGDGLSDGLVDGVPDAEKIQHDIVTIHGAPLLLPDSPLALIAEVDHDWIHSGVDAETLTTSIKVGVEGSDAKLLVRPIIRMARIEGRPEDP